MTVLSLDGDNLVSYELEDAIDDRLKALQDLLVGECHVTFLNAGLGELGLNTNVNSPLLTIVAEISLDSVFEVHDALCVDTAGSL